jgi:hypothetical protein
MLNIKLITSAQEEWGAGVIAIGKDKEDKRLYTAKAQKFLNDTYAFDSEKVMFKPTKPFFKQFISNKEDALSYFIHPQKGFALQPWIEIKFTNYDFIFKNNQALCIGNYSFKDTKKDILKADYTFGYIKDSQEKVKINLHHSSLAFK